MIKTPPNSLEAEQGVIGALMIGAQFDSVSELVSSDDFYYPQNRSIFLAAASLAMNRAVIDIITLSDVLERQNLLNEIGGLAYLAELAKNTPSAAHAIEYAKIIRDKAQRRRIIIAAQEIAGLGYGEGLLDDIVRQSQSLTMAFDAHSKADVAVSISEVMAGIVHDFDNPNPHVGFKTGFPDMDKILTGLEKGAVHIIAARPSTGKTALAINIIENIAQEGAPVLIFSLEMTAKSLGRRMIASLGRVNNHAIKTRDMEGQWDKFAAGVTKAKALPIHIYERSGLSIAEICTRARFQKKANKTEVIVIDFLQLIRREKSNKSTSDEVGLISNEIKNLAKELDVAIILLSQLNRGIEGRSDKQPVLSDLRSSGDIEQDAETITFMYRPILEANGLTTITVAKNRDGETGQCNLVLNGKYSRFESSADNTPQDGRGGKKSWSDDW